MLRSLACAITFLTRIPLPRFQADADDVARSAAWFAPVGMLLGVSLWLASVYAEHYLGARIAALLTLSLWVAVTGGLHLDGLADTADGFSGGHGDREKTLTIMRDSRIGAHGAVAVMLVLAGKWALLEPMMAHCPPHFVMALVSARLVCTVLMATFPYARTAGLGSMYAQMPRARVIVAGAVTWLLVALWLGGGFRLSLPSVVGSLVGAAFALLLALRARRLLGGLTGDVYGAAIELGELGCLLGIQLSALR